MSISVAFCLHKVIIEMRLFDRSCGGPLSVQILMKGSRFWRRFAQSGGSWTGFALLVIVCKGLGLLGPCCQSLERVHSFARGLANYSEGFALLGICSKGYAFVIIFWASARRVRSF